MPFTLIRQDITNMQVDAIVNAANPELRMGGGVCGAIFRAAGPRQLQEACDLAGPIATGSAAITPGFRLPATYVIHAAGPIYAQWAPQKARQLLWSAYTSSLKLAAAHNCQSIAFPLISSGIYGYPKAEALEVAVDAIGDFLQDHEMMVYLVIFDRASLALSEVLLGAVDQYIDETYVDAHTCYGRSLAAEALPMEAAEPRNLDQIMEHLDEPFNKTLLRLIDARDMTDVEVYKRANLDRKLFSKIRTGKGYLPGKRTILALAIALELSLEETDDLLQRAGYALSHSQKFDVILEFFIIHGQYDIYEINQVLFRYDQPLLGG